ncbi:flavohemoglobin expression-modulating QEGLA motif protein [Kytococcus sedentarius]|uniref:flavohemoglobin expression-modulating QEGLA motif protein n=1 Tax=Kytococcus sedentarius TaxID=1276 RepID=UPI003879775A
MSGTPSAPEGREALSPADLAVDHTLAMLSDSMRFLLDITPVNSDEEKERFISGTHEEPTFVYRDLETDPAIQSAQIAQVALGEVEDPTVAKLLQSKRRELSLQIDMLRARGTDDFRQLSAELYGAVGPSLRDTAEDLVARLEVPSRSSQMVDAEGFLAAAQEEIDAYRELDPDVSIHAEVRSDVAGVLVEGDTLLISNNANIPAPRVRALLMHEVGTHLVTQVNGVGQQMKTLGSGLAGYDETQEGLAVLAEVAVGGLTSFRLRQLALRVLTVHRMLNGATFREAYQAMRDVGVPPGSAFTTTMRAYRSGGHTKDAMYLRGLVDLLAHLREGGRLDLLFLGKFALRDLPLVQELDERGHLRPSRITSRWLLDPGTRERLDEAAAADDLTTLTEDPA